MSTDYPTSLDAYLRPSASNTLNSPSHAGVHDNAYDAIEALEAKVGADASTVKTSLDWLSRGHACRVTRAAAQSIPDSAVTTVNWDTEIFDTDGFHDNVTNNSRITIPAGWPTGFWVVSFQVALAFDADGSRRFAAIYKNGVAADVEGHHHRPGPSGGTGADMISASGTARLVAGDYLEVVALHDAGAAIDLFALDAQSHFSISWQGKE